MGEACYQGGLMVACMGLRILMGGLKEADRALRKVCWALLGLGSAWSRGLLLSPAMGICESSPKGMVPGMETLKVSLGCLLCADDDIC